jgi:hypothetical protein
MAFPLLDDLEHWRNRAEESQRHCMWYSERARSVADQLSDPESKRTTLEVRKRALAAVLRIKAGAGIQFNEHCDDLPADAVFRHACRLGFEGIVSKRLGSPYRSGRSRDWLKMKNPNAPAAEREAEEDWGRERW